jgi:hypothetical protein
MTRSALALGLALALTATAAGAAEDTKFYQSANFWLRYCKAWLDDAGGPLGQDAPIRLGICVGEVGGVAYAASAAPPSAPSCVDIPGGANYEQMVRVVIAYIEARPSRMHENFDLLALEALRTTWPCK